MSKLFWTIRSFIKEALPVTAQQLSNASLSLLQVLELIGVGSEEEERGRERRTFKLTGWVLEGAVVCWSHPFVQMVGIAESDA